MRIRLTLAALVLVVATTPAQTVIPDTPAGRVLMAWITAFNSGDAERIRQFDSTYREKPEPVERTLRLREVTGGFTVVQIEKNENNSIVALATEAESDTLTRIEFAVAGPGPKLTESKISPTPRPAELAIPRVTEAAALAALSERIDAQAKADKFSGAVLVARGNKVVLQKAAGSANRETNTPNTPDTKFRIGSMNKMFTSVATLHLVEAGKISLDDPIGKHLTDYPNKDVATKVTIRQLLSHRGGTGDIFGPDFAKNRLTLKEHSDYLKLYGERGLGHEPGAEFRYSNYGFVLLGAIIERVSGMSYYDYVQRNVFEPAGMKNTASLAETDAVPNRSVGYMKRDGAWTANTDTLPWRGTAAGGGYSTVGDLFKFAQALQSGKLVSKATLAEATKAQSSMGEGFAYGYGFGVIGEGPTRHFGHNGGAPGMNGDLRIYPQLGYVIVALSNLDPPAASRMVDFVGNRLPAKSGS
jgi:CubicO group peptidase (beta-lactamase class C family)